MRFSVDCCLAILVIVCTWSFRPVSGDEPLPSLEQAIGNPRIPMIIDATILRFDAKGAAEIQVNAVYKPVNHGAGARPPVRVRGTIAPGSDLLTPMRLLVNKGDTRLLLFTDGDLLFASPPSHFAIRQGEDRELMVDTGRGWVPLSQIIKLIPESPRDAST